MPARFHGHALTRDATKNRKCMICGKKTKTICGCGRAICSSAGGVTLLSLERLLSSPCSGSVASDSEHDWRVCFRCGVLLRACLVPPAARNVVLSGGVTAAVQPPACATSHDIDSMLQQPIFQPTLHVSYQQKALFQQFIAMSLCNVISTCATLQPSETPISLQRRAPPFHTPHFDTTQRRYVHFRMRL
jgi:hypothetical protein